MNATVQAVSPSFDEMIVELMTDGTIAGCSSLQEMEAAEIGVNLFVREDGIKDDNRLRELSGVALSRGITYTRLLSTLHLELVERLRLRLQSDLSSGALGGHVTPLFEELTRP